MARKRLELLERKREQLAARRHHDAALDAEIAALADKVSVYQAAPRHEPPAGLVQIKRRTDAGLVRAGE